jgi:molybdopterin-guanine dinucleotide biosynthesis protein A
MTGIILAGGQSRRMGQDKAQLPWCGGTLLSVTVDKLSLLCREIVVVGPKRDLAREVRWTQDRYPGRGPLAGFHAGLAEAVFAGALVLPCDMPEVPVSLLARLAEVSAGADIAIPVHANGYEPLCAWYSREACLPVTERLLAEGYSRLLDVLPRVRVGQLHVEKEFPGLSIAQLFSNLNRLHNYEAAKRGTADF